MKSGFLGLLAVGLLAAPMAGHAAAVRYETTFSGTVSGPSGTGSFYFDAATGLITNFVWNLGSGAFVGGIADTEFTGAASGDTRGRWLFEEIGDVNVHSGVSCIDGCSIDFAVTGAPSSAQRVIMYGSDLPDGSGGGFYRFMYSSGPGQAYVNVAEGSIKISQAPVPLPAAAWLLLSGIAGLGVLRRRKAAW